ncbi:MAG TPA: DUF4244 domain-containing protein [Kineosporiaceae bacterium]|nr:DUF4244 domain-containing protein [Kineosporiaceae bacterium]
MTSILGLIGWLLGRRRTLRSALGRRAAHVRDAGMATAEYAIATLAACGFAGLLLVLMRSDEVRGLLLGIVRRALSVS